MPVEQSFGQRRVIIPVLERIFGATYNDMRRMETLLRGSDLDWVRLRPPRLVSKKGPAVIAWTSVGPCPRRAASRTPTAALLDSLARPDLYRRTAYVAS